MLNIEKSIIANNASQPALNGRFTEKMYVFYATLIRSGSARIRQVLTRPGDLGPLTNTFRVGFSGIEFGPFPRDFFR